MKFFTKLFKDEGEKAIKRLEPIVAHINTLEQDYVNLSDAELAGKTEEFKKRIQEGGETVDDLLPEAFAVVREGARRTLGQRHYDVQLMGGIIMHQGAIPEMRTGEGKTLVATLPTYLNALTGKGVHVVTVNDYLSRRDAVWMGQVYTFLGLSVGLVLSDMAEKDFDKKKIAYQADITYGTNNEFGFDYLRDNMSGSIDQCCQRPYNFAIVDEVDSILIDEARTPLIISGRLEKSAETYKTMARIAPQLQKDVHYEVE